MKENKKGTLIFYGIIGILLLGSLLFYVLRQQSREPEELAVVHLGSKEILRADLSKNGRFLIEDGEVTEVSSDFVMSDVGDAEELRRHHINILEIKDGEISCIEANCPDLTCVHIPAMSGETDGIPIACLPHGMVISIE